jgi:CRISPR-associated protein Cas2
MSRAGWWIVAYDITGPRRLARVHRFLKKRGLATQYSVFTVETNAAGLNVILAGVGKLIDRRKDDIRVYPMAPKAEIITLGRPVLPGGVVTKTAPSRAA